MPAPSLCFSCEVTSLTCLKYERLSRELFAAAMTLTPPLFYEAVVIHPLTLDRFVLPQLAGSESLNRDV